MKLAMTSGQLMAAMREIPGDFEVQIQDGDSNLAQVDYDKKTVTVCGAGKPKAAPKAKAKK